jgi:hypothetical protein
VENEHFQHVIAGGVTVTVVDSLHSIDVDEGDDEAPVGSPCAVDLLVQRKPSHIATKSSSEIVEVGRLQLRLQASPLCGGTRLILRGPSSTGRGTSARRCGTSADLPEPLRQWLVGEGERALQRLFAKVPSLRHFVTRSGDSVTLVGRLGAQTSRHRSGVVSRETTRPALVVREAQGGVDWRDRSAGIDQRVLVGIHFITLGGALIAGGVGFVLVRRGLILGRRGLICVGYPLVGIRSRPRDIDRPLSC